MVTSKLDKLDFDRTTGACLARATGACLEDVRSAGVHERRGRGRNLGGSRLVRPQHAIIAQVPFEERPCDLPKGMENLCKQAVETRVGLAKAMCEGRIRLAHFEKRSFMERALGAILEKLNLAA